MKNGDLTISVFLENLSSSAPVPGGGGAAALCGALGAALCSMVAGLTAGSAKYAVVHSEITSLLEEAKRSTALFTVLTDKDGEAFSPLAAAYRIPKNTPGRDKIMEEALCAACAVPLEIMEAVLPVLGMAEFLATNGSAMAVSDAGAAAALCRGALESAVLNIFANTKLMKCREKAAEYDRLASGILSDGVSKSAAVYGLVMEKLTGAPL